MPSATAGTRPLDQAERERALDARRCVLVRAPAGSGKTDLLTRRFLRLLGEVGDPGVIVAITFTRAAAAEMRHRILAELEKAAAHDRSETADEFSMEALAQRALERSRLLGWNLVDLPAQLRISTIDAFCRELALQRPLLSGLGGGLDPEEEPRELYRRAARRTLEAIDQQNAALREAIETLLLWRDNGWQEMENQLVEMLAQRDRWMRDFVVDRDPDWDALRERLERPFANRIRDALAELNQLLDRVPGAREEALDLARFACAQTEGALHRELAELAEFPAAPFDTAETLEGARQACACLSTLLLTNDGGFRKQVNKTVGFPVDRKQEKNRLMSLIADLDAIPDLSSALAAARDLPPARYTEEDWRIVRACFVLLRRAAAELQVVFAEAGAVDYIEVAQVAESVLRGESEIPSEAALAAAGGIRHLLVDEFQDTSRRQHQLLARLIAAWDEREGRTCFVVGDPMQSIYFFRDADAELFPRVEKAGLEIPNDPPLEFDSVALSANFRAVPPLVTRLNDFFEQVFEADDGSGVKFSRAEAALAVADRSGLHLVQEEAQRMTLHLDFMPEPGRAQSGDRATAREQERNAAERQAAREKQIAEIVDVIRGHLGGMECARAEKAKYRVAVLGRTRSVLAPIADALRQATIPFRAVELEKLKERPEVLDALALVRALLNPQDRIAWLGVLRAPWCGLSLADLHTLASADDTELMRRPVVDLLAERLHLLSEEGRASAARVLQAIQSASALRFGRPASSLGTWLEQAWLELGGAQCVDAAGRANVDLLWRCLDRLPEGEQDVLGPALDAALDRLTALPDPAVDGDCGVHLMTIHKSKGLEFEVVIVPELQTRGSLGRTRLLSWLERGLAEPDDSGEPTEFLVAALPSKGADRGEAKRWVDSVYRARESQEMRRILYVAATRARRALHLFALAGYKSEKDGSLSLVQPRQNLLATAWPALEDEIRERFDAWRKPQEIDVAAIAATEEIHPSALSPNRGSSLRRLPSSFRVPQDAATFQAAASSIIGSGQLYARHEGGFLSRALGVSVHLLLEELTRLRATQEWDEARSALADFAPRVAAQARSAGIERSQASRIAEKGLEIVLAASRDPKGQWILSPHPDAASEVRWAGVVDGSLRTVQIDRLFRAGEELLADGDDVWWIVDYKTAHEDTANPEAMLPALRRLFAPQLAAYAQVLRQVHGADAELRAGLYYPRMSQFDWWKI